MKLGSIKMPEMDGLPKLGKLHVPKLHAKHALNIRSLMKSKIVKFKKDGFLKGAPRGWGRL